MENCLSGKNSEEIKQHYRKNLNLGGWFSFNSTKEEWKEHFAEEMLNHFFDIELIDKAFKGFSVDSELLLTNNINFSGLKNKSVLVIGGGPSTNLLTEKEIVGYDYVFSCNHFFRNTILSKVKVDVCLVGDEVDLDSKNFNNYIEKYNPAVGFEHSARRTTSDLIRFRKRYPKCFVYLTRYFSRLGFVPRAITIASLADPKQIDYIGMDGFKSGAYTHSFELNKAPPPFNESERFKQQMKVFLKYILFDVKLHKDKINDLGHNHSLNIYAGMLDRIKNEEN